MVDRLFRERLPEGWSCCATEDGRVFFIDELHRRTTWLHPVHRCPIQSGHYTDESLPFGWEMNFDHFQKPYYINHETLSTTYNHPRQLDSPDYSPPEHVKMKAEHGAAFANKRSNVRKSFSRRKSLSDPPSAKRDINAPVVMQGWLLKQESGFMKSWKKRWAVLTDYHLFLYKNMNETEENEVGSVVLAGYWINRCTKSESGSQKFAFKIEHKDTKPIILAADTEDETNEWMLKLTSVAAIPGVTDQFQFKAPGTEPVSNLHGNKENFNPDYARNPPSAFSYPSPQNYSLQSGNYNQNQPQNVTHGQLNNYGSQEIPVYGVMMRQKPDVDPWQMSARQPTGEYNAGLKFTSQEPSATSTPVVNLNGPNWNGLPEHDSHNAFPATRGLMTDGHMGYGGRGRFADDPSQFDGRNFAPQQQTWKSFDQFGRPLSSAGSFSQIPRNNERQMISDAGVNSSFPLSHSINGSTEFPSGGQLSVSRTSDQHGLNSQNPAMKYSGQINSDQLKQSFNSTNPRFDSSFSNPQFSRSTSLVQMKPSPHDDGFPPPQRPPVPTALRDLYIDELAEAKTPHSKQDMLLSKEISQKRLNEPNYFQFPESPPRQAVRDPYNFPSDSRQLNSSYSQRELQGLNPAAGFPANAEYPREPASNREYPREPAPAQHPQSVKLNRLQQENRISRSADELVPTGNDVTNMLPDQRNVLPQNSMVNNYSYNSGGGLAALSPKVNRKAAVASRPFEAIKEDPNMSDTDVLNTRTLQDMQKHMLGHARLRLSISVRDLVGKSQEELVLLLIQLRRSQSKLEEMLTWARNRLQNARPQEKAYKLERKNSFGRLEDALEHGHEYYVQLQKQADEIEKQIDVTQPLINLLDNIVTMGSLYNGDNLMYASQYKKGQLHPDQVVPTKRMLEFSRMNQEEKLASKQEQSIRQLTEDEVDLEEKLQQLYALDAELQEHSNTVTSLQEDKVMLEQMLDEIKKAEKSETDMYVLERLAQQRQMCEKNLTTVRQNLADASKNLEETSIENARVEQQVVVLRNKIHGGLVKSQSSPSLVSGSMRDTQKMEEELKGIQTMMQSLTSQGTKISEAMESLRSSKRDFKGPTQKTGNANAKAVGYMETDLDSRISRDISVRQDADDRMGGYWPSSANTYQSHGSGAVFASQNLSSSGSLSKGPSSGGRIEYKYVTPPSAGQFVGQSRSQPVNQYGSLMDNQYNGQRQNQNGGQWNNNRYNDDWRNQDSRFAANQFHSHPNVNANGLESRGGQLPTSASYEPNSVRNVKRREMSRRNPAEPFQFEDDSQYSVLRRSRSLPRVHTNNVGLADIGRQSMNERARRNSAHHLANPPPMEIIRPSSAMHRLFPIATQNSSAGDPTPQIYPERMNYAPSSGLIKVVGPQNEPQKRFTDHQFGEIQSQPAGRPTTYVGSSNVMFQSQPWSQATDSSRPHFNSYIPAANPDGRHAMELGIANEKKSEVPAYDDFTIDKALFERPRPVEIPERYVPDSSDEDETLSFDERMRRKEKADQFKRMIAKQSLQEFSQGELTLKTGPVRHQVNDEARRREQLLDVKRSLAQEVMMRSKEDAALRRKSSASTGMFYAEDGLSA